jgi:hypothetical protein
VKREWGHGGGLRNGRLFKADGNTGGKAVRKGIEPSRKRYIPFNEFESKFLAAMK